MIRQHARKAESERTSTLLCKNRAVERLAHFLRKNLGSKWFLQEGSTFFERSIFGDDVVRIARHIEDAKIVMPRCQPLCQLVATHSRHDHVRQQEMNLGSMISS